MQKLLSTITVSTADRKLIDAVSGSIGKLDAVGVGCLPSSGDFSNPNWRSKLHLEHDRLYQELAANPSPEAAERFHAAFIRSEQAAVTAEMICEALRESRRNESAKLATVVSNVIDAAEAKIDSESATFRKSLSEADKSAMFTADIATHDSRVLDLKKRLADERTRASADPYSWLENHALV